MEVGRQHCKSYCAMPIGGRVVMVDIEDYELLPGDRAAVIRHDGSIGVSEVSPASSGVLFGGERSALEIQDMPGMFSGCVIIGRVVA